MERIIRGYYKNSNRTWTVVVENVMRPDGTTYSYRREGFLTEEAARAEAELAKSLNRRATMDQLFIRENIIPVSIFNAHQQGLPDDRVTVSSKQNWPSRQKSLKSFFDLNYKLNYLESIDEKVWLGDQISYSANSNAQRRNIKLYLNQLITSMKRQSLLPITVTPLFVGKSEQTLNRYHHVLIMPTDDEFNQMESFLDYNSNDSGSYPEKIFACATIVILECKYIQWHHIINIQTDDWILPELFINKKHFIVSDRASVALNTAKGDKKNGRFLFSSDPDGLTPLPYLNRLWFRKCFSKKIIGRRVSFEAFKLKALHKTQNEPKCMEN